MDPNEEVVLRQYLRRKIAVQNNSINGMTKVFRDEAKILRNNIFTYFARGEHGSFAATTSNLNLYNIREHIRYTGNKMSPYNYFDLDTLIAYNEFLEMLLNNANINRMKNRRQTFDINDFEVALKYSVSKYFLEHAGEEVTGYYNLDCPVRMLKDERKRPMPERTPDAKAFDKKYPVSYCEKLLSQYLDERHPVERHKHVEVDQKIEKEEPERIDFVYKNEQYVVQSEDYFLSEENYPIKYIVANSLDGKKHLMGYFDMSMIEYIGDVYDTENNFIYSREDSGVEVFDIHDHSM